MKVDENGFHRGQNFKLGHYLSQIYLVVRIASSKEVDSSFEITIFP